MPDASKASVIAARLAWLADTTRRTPTAEGRDVTLDALLVWRPFSLEPSPALPQPASASATRAATATCSKRVRRASKLHPAAAPAMLLDAPLSSMTVLASRPSGRAATPGCRRRNDGVGPVPGSPRRRSGTARRRKGANMTNIPDDDLDVSTVGDEAEMFGTEPGA